MQELWTARREWEGGGGSRSDEALTMLPRSGRAVDDITGGGGVKGVARGKLEADNWTRAGGWATQGKRVADDCTTQQEGGGIRHSWRQ